MLFGTTCWLIVRVVNVIGAKYHKYCCQNCIQTSISWRGRGKPGRNTFTSVFLLSLPKISRSYIPSSVSQRCVVPRSEKTGQTAPPGSQGQHLNGPLLTASFIKKVFITVMD